MKEKKIIFKFHPLEFVDDIIHGTFCEGIIFKFHPQKKPKIKISMVQFRVRLVKELSSGTEVARSDNSPWVTYNTLFDSPRFEYFER
mgnify:CR=1 FL=1